jgi:preprotein translocase subunit Sss1
VAGFADFILTQKPKALCIMLVKACIMAAVLFILGCVGYAVAVLADYAINDFIWIGDLLLYLYLVIAIPMAVFILFGYIIRLAHNMTGKAETTSSTSTPIDFINMLCGFAKKGFIILLKIFVACVLIVLLCTLVLTVAFTGFALVFVVTGYPTIGIFIVGLGFCISCTAFMLITSKLAFFGRENI